MRFVMRLMLPILGATLVGASAAEHSDRVCSVLKEGKIDVAIPTSAWFRDVRIRAAVIAAPTLGFTFTPSSLAAVTAPMQLWRAAPGRTPPPPPHHDALAPARPRGPDYHAVPRP